MSEPTANQQHIAALAAMGDAELRRRLAVLLDLMRHGRAEARMVDNAWFACVAAGKQWLWHEVLDDRRAERARVFRRAV